MDHVAIIIYRATFYLQNSGHQVRCRGIKEHREQREGPQVTLSESQMVELQHMTHQGASLTFLLGFNRRWPVSFWNVQEKQTGYSE